MENSAYVPNPLPPPALVVFSQAGGLPEALRMQRPFNTQAPEAKDLHVPFSTGGFGLRHMDSYPSLPAHLLHHLQPQFLHPALDPRVPFGSGAFRPLGSATTSDIKGFPSAFAPPSKCLKIETSSGNHHDSVSTPSNHLSTLFSPGVAAEERAFLNGQSQQQRADSSSPASVSISPPILPPVVKEESSDAPMSSEDREGTATPGSEGTERSTPEEGRGFRLGPLFGPGAGRCGTEALGLGLFGPAYRFAAAAKSRCLLLEQGKKKFSTDPSCCPVCGVTVRPGELEPHFVQEVERLYKLTAPSRARRLPPPPPPQRRDAIASVQDSTPEGRWDTYQRIKANRQGRLRIKNRKRKADEATCPVCNERVTGSVDELNGHVEICLRKHGGAPDEEENVDVEGDSEMFEEYEWAGQRRIRATTLLVGGFTAAGMTNASAGDEDVDLVVDGDDNAVYGPSQYTEADVVPPSAGPREAKERDALREALISPDGTKSSSNVEVKEEPGPSQSAGATEPPEDGPVVQALKNRIRELENESKASEEKFKCLICLELYKKPVISVCCWHVHCEECWLHTLGAKKLCPQCNMITSPSDLRRIYM